MIECITAANAHANKGILEQMFRARYELFVKARGWRDLDDGSGLERDQFDTSDAVYLLSVDAAGDVIGGMRLVPTIKPHLLSEMFSHFAAGGVLRGSHVYEMTRYFTVRDRARAREMRRASGELLCAMFEYCLDADGEWITTLFDTFYLRRMKENGWEETPLGPPTLYGEGTAIAIKIPVSGRNLERTRSVHGIAGPVLRNAPVSPVRVPVPKTPQPARVRAGRELEPV